MGGDPFAYLDTPIGLGDSVAAIDAGNTAMDCLRQWPATRDDSAAFVPPIPR